ncbi:hypothetical protein D3C81_834240 [compost metagenome]
MVCPVIDMDAWLLVVRILFAVMPLLIALVGVAMNVYVTLTRDYEIACSSITSNPFIENLKVTWGASHFKWRFCLVCAIGGLVNFPGSALRRGQLDAAELKAFPTGLKRRLAISLWLTLIGFGWMTVIALAMEVSKRN